MYRGTTPTFRIIVDTDLTEAESIYVTFSQGGQTVVEKNLEDLTVTAESISFTLSQEDTLAFNPTVSGVEVQVRAKLADDTAIASNITRLTVAAILKDGEI